MMYWSYIFAILFVGMHFLWNCYALSNQNLLFQEEFQVDTSLGWLFFRDLIRVVTLTLLGMFCNEVFEAILDYVCGE